MKDEATIQSSFERYYKNEHPLRTFFHIYSSEKKKIYLSLIIGAIKHLPLMVMPVVIGNIINVITDQTHHTLKELWWNSAIIIVLLIQNVPMHTLFIRCMSTAVRSVEVRLRNALVRRFQELSIAFHDHFQSGRLQSKMLRDVESVEGMARQFMNTLFMSTITILFAFGVTVYKHPLVALFFVGSVPIAVGMVQLFKEKITSSNREFRGTIEKMSAMMAEMITMIPVTRAHAAEHKEIRRINTQLEQVKNTGIRVDTLTAVFGSSTWVTFQSFQFICLLVTGFMALKGKIGVGDVVMYQGFFGQIVGSVSSIINVFPEFARGFESIRSLGEILQSPDIEYNQGKKVVTHVEGRFDFDQVSFKYRNTTRPAIDRLSFTIQSGECVAFVGPSGSGKSTLMNLIIGFRRPDGGRILLDGVDMQELDLRTYRRFLAVVPQNTVLFSGTIRDNITYGIDSVCGPRLDQAVEMANLGDVIAGLPKGIDTVVGENGATLSGGQRQRVAIARALIRDPRVIILDEATSALDVASEKLVQEAITRLINGRTSLIVAHRLSTIRIANRIAVLREGKCTESGTHDELMRKEGEFYNLKTLQV